MTDLERRIRDLLEDDARSAPSPLDAGPVVGRTRRRQVRTAVIGGLLALTIGIGALAGVTALLRLDEGIPAIPDLPPPSEAPIVVGSGEAEGWRWLLSTSEDGTCVALTDEQGSQTSCSTEPEPGGATGFEDAVDVLDVAIRSPRTPAPPLVFVFGRVSSRTETVDVTLGTFEETPGEVFPTPGGVERDDRYFVRWASGYPRPVVPDAFVLAVGPGGDLLDVASVERPSWAVPPFTTVATIASGMWTGPVGSGQEWGIGIYRDELTEELCFGEPPGDVCGPASDPAPAWFSAWDQLDVVSERSRTEGGQRSSFAWGVFRDPVVSVRVELADGRVVEPDVYPPRPEYPLPFSVFVFEFEGDVGGRVVGFDAAGDVVARDRVGLDA
jgi:hypothetical protein